MSATRPAIIIGAVESVHSATTLLAISLLAVLPPVYVLAMSLLGRVFRKAEKSRHESIARLRIEFTQKVKEAMDEKTEEAKPHRRYTVLRHKVRDVEKAEKREVKRIERQWKCLGTTRIVALPGCLFLGALILNVLSDAVRAPIVHCPAARCAPEMIAWGGAVVLLAAGICVLYSGLKHIEQLRKVPPAVGGGQKLSGGKQ